jgi:hypothetical protein
MRRLNIWRAATRNGFQTYACQQAVVFTPTVFTRVARYLTGIVAIFQPIVSRTLSAKI